MSHSTTALLNSIVFPSRDGRSGTSETAEASKPDICDEVLISQVSTGNSNALSLLFRRYARVVRMVAYRVLRDPFEADDLAQELFLAMPRKCRAFNSSKGSARSWILQMAYHSAISRRRYLACRHFYTAIDLDNREQACGDSGREAANIEEAIDKQLGAGNLQKLLETLSENQRRTLKLYFFEGYSLNEIARELGQSRENVRHHYFRGLEKLRKQILSKQSPR